MPVELRTQRDGRVRDSWYGRYEVNGRRIYINLGVKVAGSPPESLSLKDEGDTAFERSRAAALAKLDGIIAESRSQNNAERLVEKLYEIKTGETIKSVKLSDLPDEWARISRKRKPDDRYASQCQSTLRRFASSIREQNPKANEIAHVTGTAARRFMDAESKRGVTAKTWNDTLKLLRATFRHLMPAGAINPFVNVATRETETIFRLPFTPEDLKAIADACQDDDFIRPIIVTGICTAMRRGDCCLLQWKDVDLKQRFITVKTAKTGQTVSIPIFPMLFEELSKRPQLRNNPPPHPLPGRGGEGVRKHDYVFPEQAAMYLENPDGITWRVKKVLAVALGGDLANGRSKIEDGDRNAKREHLIHPADTFSPSDAEKGGGARLAKVPDMEARRRGLEYIAGLPDSAKKERMRAVFDFYMDGKKCCEVATTSGVSKGSVSGYLNEIEAASECRIVRGRSAAVSLTARLKNDCSLLRVERENGERDASVRDFHSFRVTWVTLALTAGVPLELVQKVTGHKTTDIVLKHYFQPGREAFRSALNAAMPKLLMSGSVPTEKDETAEGEIGSQRSEARKRDNKIKEILERSTAKTWKRDQARVLELLAQGQQGKN